MVQFITGNFMAEKCFQFIMAVISDIGQGLKESFFFYQESARRDVIITHPWILNVQRHLIQQHAFYYPAIRQAEKFYQIFPMPCLS